VNKLTEPRMEQIAEEMKEYLESKMIEIPEEDKSPDLSYDYSPMMGDYLQDQTPSPAK